MSSLYELTETYKKAEAEILACDVDEQTMLDTLESLTAPIEEKALNVAKFIRNMDADISAIDDAVKQMQARSKTAKPKRDAMLKYLKDNMELAQIDRLSCPFFELAIVKNPASVVLTGEVPDEFRTVKEVVSVNKTKIKAALKAGELPFAELSNTTRLRIK